MKNSPHGNRRRTNIKQFRCEEILQQSCRKTIHGHQYVIQRAILRHAVVELRLADEEFALLSPVLQEKIIRFVVGRPGGYCVFEGLDFDLLPIAFYINHSCEGNLGCDPEGSLVALRDISKAEELTYDYGLVEARPDFVMECTCGTPSCRKKITGNDWRDPAFRSAHKEFLHPDLRPEPE